MIPFKVKIKERLEFELDTNLTDKTYLHVISAEQLTAFMNTYPVYYIENKKINKVLVVVKFYEDNSQNKVKVDGTEIQMPSYSNKLYLMDLSEFEKVKFDKINYYISINDECRKAKDAYGYMPHTYRNSQFEWSYLSNRIKISKLIRIIAFIYRDIVGVNTYIDQEYKCAHKYYYNQSYNKKLTDECRYNYFKQIYTSPNSDKLLVQDFFRDSEFLDLDLATMNFQASNSTINILLDKYFSENENDYLDKEYGLLFSFNNLKLSRKIRKIMCSLDYGNNVAIQFDGYDNGLVSDLYEHDSLSLSRINFNFLTAEQFNQEYADNIIEKARSTNTQFAKSYKKAMSKIDDFNSAIDDVLLFEICNVNREGTLAIRYCVFGNLTKTDEFSDTNQTIISIAKAISSNETKKIPYKNEIRGDDDIFGLSFLSESFVHRYINLDVFRKYKDNYTFEIGNKEIVIVYKNDNFTKRFKLLSADWKFFELFKGIYDDETIQDLEAEYIIVSGMC